MELKIKSGEVGIEYLKELKKVVDIRKDRKIIYGDLFLTDGIDSLLKIVDTKKARFESIRKLHKFHTKMIDEIQDIINYYFFILCLLNKEKNGK